MNSSNWRCHAAPSPSAKRSNSATFASSDVVEEHRRAVRERGPGRELRVDVLEAARVEVVRELRVGGGPWNSGCHELITSCVKPGSV